jgi:uncharacterized protein (DUF1697 family)
MARYIALLKGVNVSGKHLLPMARLRAICEALGWKDVSTLLQSGNVVLTAPDKTAAGVERKLAEALAAEFPFAPEVIARTPGEWAKVVKGNPFPEAAASAPNHLLVGFFKHLPKAGLESLPAGLVRDEVLRLEGRELYATFPSGIGKSKLDFKRVEHHLGSTITMRNWNTLVKLNELVGN